MRLRLIRAVVAAVVGGSVAVPAANAARIPTPPEREALHGLIRAAVGDRCTGRQSTPLPLVAGDAHWGSVAAVCEHAGDTTSAWAVWARRSSVTATDWAPVRDAHATRVPRCTGEDGLFRRVPQSVVRDLRGECYDLRGGHRPSPSLSLRVPRDGKPEYDVGPSLDLSSDGQGNGGGDGLFSIMREGPPIGTGSTPTLKDLTSAFGRARRTGCRARWPRVALSAVACRPGIVTKLVLGPPWQMLPDEGDLPHLGNASARVGDDVALAAYLDPRLRGLRPDGRFRMSRTRIGDADVTVEVVTRGARLKAIEIDVDQRPATGDFATPLALASVVADAMEPLVLGPRP